MSSRVSIANKRRFLDDSGYTLFAYTGQLRNAPPQLKHLLRECPPGWYVSHHGLKLLYPLPAPPVNMVGASQIDWLATEAFYMVCAHLLPSMGWVFYGRRGQDISILDTRADPRWDAENFRQRLLAYPDQYPDGYYATQGTTEVGAFAHERDMLEAAAIQSGYLDGYYSDVQPVGRPFNGVLRPVNVASNVYGLLTDHNQMVATVINNPGLGDALATARMLSLAPEMLALLDYLAVSPADEYPQIAEAASQLRKRVFEPE